VIFAWFNFTRRAVAQVNTIEGIFGPLCGLVVDKPTGCRVQSQMSLLVSLAGVSTEGRLADRPFFLGKKEARLMPGLWWT